MTPLVIGVTSHRNIPAHEIEAVRQRVRDFLAQMQHDFPGLPLLVLSALAEGGDQLVAQEALAAGARVIAPLPLPRDVYASDFTAAGRATFAQLCQRVEVLPLPLLPGNSAAAVAVPGAARDRQYAHAGVFISSHSHVLLGLWNGHTSDLLGGTAQVVRYHLEGIMPGLIERRHSAQMVLECGDESLMYHIACSRSDADGVVQPPLPPLQPLQTRWVDQSGAHAASAGMPAEFRRMFLCMQQFNADARRHGQEIDAFARSQETDPPAKDALTSIDRLFVTADWLALHFQQQVLRTMRGLYVLATLMGIAFVSYSDLPHQGDAIYVFIVLFAAGVGLAWLARRRGWHRKYIDYRALAEGLRVQRYWRAAGIATAGSGVFAHENFMQKQDIELGWIRNVMRAAGVCSFQAAPVSAAAMAAVVSAWIGIAAGDGQLGYYTRKAAQCARLHHATQRVARSLLCIVIAISLCLAIFHRQLDPDTTTYLVAVMGVLAIIAAARESYAFRKADRELIKQYRYMCNIFATARRKLDAAPDVAARREILRALGEAALAEHAEWALMHRERPPEHGKL
jgi:hypothetical protein